MSEKLQPALLGGVLIGVLSALPFVGTCCCLWVIGGGVLTTYLLQERITRPVTAGDASVTGLLAGVIGALIATVVGQLLALLRGGGINQAIDEMVGRGGQLPPELIGALERVRDLPGIVFVLGSLIIALIIYPIFSMLGALLGVAMFKKNAPPAPPGGGELPTPNFQLPNNS